MAHRTFQLKAHIYQFKNTAHLEGAPYFYYLLNLDACLLISCSSRSSCYNLVEYLTGDSWTTLERANSISIIYQ